MGGEPSLCCNSLSRKSSCSTTQKRWGVSYACLAFDRAFEPQRKFSEVTNKTTLGRSTHGRIGDSDLFVYWSYHQHELANLSWYVLKSLSLSMCKINSNRLIGSRWFQFTSYLFPPTIWGLLSMVTFTTNDMTFTLL